MAQIDNRSDEYYRTKTEVFNALIDTIEENFDIPINHYVQVDFAGFRGLVDAVGSVPVWFDAPARDFNAAEGISQTGFEALDPGCINDGIQGVQPFPGFLRIVIFGVSAHRA